MRGKTVIARIAPPGLPRLDRRGGRGELFALLQRAGFPEKAVRNTTTPDREKCSRADETKKRLSALSLLVRRGGTEWRPSAAGGGRFRRDISPPKVHMPIATWSRTRLPASSMPATMTRMWPLLFFSPTGTGWRSEERRVGKEWRCGRTADTYQ